MKEFHSAFFAYFSTRNNFLPGIGQYNNSRKYLNTCHKTTEYVA